MQADAFAHQPRLQDVALDELTDEEHASHCHHHRPIRPELDEGDADGEHEAGKRTHIGDERDQPGKEADEDGEV